MFSSTSKTYSLFDCFLALWDQIFCKYVSKLYFSLVIHTYHDLFSSISSRVSREVVPSFCYGEFRHRVVNIYSRAYLFACLDLWPSYLKRFSSRGSEFRRVVVTSFCFIICSFSRDFYSQMYKGVELFTFAIKKSWKALPLPTSLRCKKVKYFDPAC